jgi:hypothetical protein
MSEIKAIHFEREENDIIRKVILYNSKQIYGNGLF